MKKNDERILRLNVISNHHIKTLTITIQRFFYIFNEVRHVFKARSNRKRSAMVYGSAVRGGQSAWLYYFTVSARKNRFVFD